ncbi:signal peptidase I [Brotaphodocola catenula]|uniref:Signal peptidase I n=1 Tax=Brotaphodocola catenula TaxID=2885361 RepID=A0AAE3AQJ6_9FIRM|nr:signal peptidase I [Brotaphodocola catenula]MCC2163850.1 signal peptidase I [Brotaphodocola catenula]
MYFYQSDESNLVRRVSSWVVDIAVALAFAWFFLNFFGSQIVVGGPSMQPLLNSGDVVLINRMAYDFGKPDRMDVVVYEREDQKTNVKRVIGIPGDTVHIQNGTVYINGEVFEEAGTVSLAGLAETPITLDEKEYFLLGDNRESSEDSRFVNVGNIREEQIIGKVWLRIAPLSGFGLIRS